MPFAVRAQYSPKLIGAIPEHVCRSIDLIWCTRKEGRIRCASS
jgi:hypothetical protein